MKVLAHPDDFVPIYAKLKADPHKNKAMLEAINNVRHQLENSSHPLGAHHKKNTIPTYYIIRYGIQLLYHFDMRDRYRLMYTVRRLSDNGQEALFLELLSHDAYNKRFSYFKKRSH